MSRLGASGQTPGVVSRGTQAQLGQGGLAHDHGVRGAYPGQARGVRGRGHRAVANRYTPGRGGDTGHVDGVLHRYPNVPARGASTQLEAMDPGSHTSNLAG